MDFLTLSFMAENVRVLVIGGGDAGFIKAKALEKRGANVTVLSKNFKEAFNELDGRPRVTLIKDDYKNYYIEDKHFVVIALGDKEKVEEIKKHCIEKNKLFLTCHNFKQGNFLVPFQEETDEMVMSIHTKKGNPLVSRFVMNKLNSEIKGMNCFIRFCNKVRADYKEGRIEKSALYFITSDDFYYFFNKGKENIVLKMFYPSDTNANNPIY